MSTPNRTGSIESASDSNARKRVCKACDRCRMKKSKCDGLSPCGRCQADNAICIFGERKKTHDKKYPHGYTEMLEQQQAQLVACTRKMYDMLIKGEKWPGGALKPICMGQPLTHDILERLDLLEVKGESGSTHDGFEDNLSVLQLRAEQAEISQSKGFKRPHSMSSDSELGHYSPSSVGSPMSQSFRLPRSVPTGHIPLTPPTATPLQAFDLQSSFKADSAMQFYGSDISTQAYVDQMRNNSGLLSSYDQLSSVDSMFPGADPALSPNIIMQPWVEFPQTEFMDMSAAT